MQIVKARLRSWFPWADGEADPIQWFALDQDCVVYAGPFDTRRELEAAIEKLRAGDAHVRTRNPQQEAELEVMRSRGEI